MAKILWTWHLIRIASCIALIVAMQAPVWAQPVTSVLTGEPDPTASFPQAKTKKGLQVEIVPDALALGIDHAAINLNLSQLIDPLPTGGSLRWSSDGKDFWFNRAYVEKLDRDIKRLSDEGVLIYLILLAIRSEDQRKNQILIHPNCVPQAPNGIGGFNTATPEGRDWLQACSEFLAERWSRPDQKFGRVVGWIAGNEVNSHWYWYNVGRMSMEEFADDYEKAVRIIHSGVRSQAKHDRVYISLEHHWAKRYAAGSAEQCFPGRDFLLAFASLAKQQERGGDFDWHIAFHPYPENLFDAAFWEDETATDEVDSHRVTLKNLPVLIDFLRQSSLQYAGQVRRVILSEQGFHSAATPESERMQAAAYCYAYKIVESLPEIDAFILHRHIDHPREGGLNLGLRRREAAEFGSEGEIEKLYPRKPIYECLRDAGTPRWRTTFQFALPLVGIQAWPESRPGPNQ